MTQEINDSNFKEIIEGAKLPVVIDFWASWCSPCLMISPVIDELSVEYNGEVAIYKCNVEDCPETAKQYGIRSIPMVTLFSKGEIIGMIMGARHKKDYENLIKKAIT